MSICNIFKLWKLLSAYYGLLTEYANVGIAIALFLLVGLQIEKQYRSIRYFDNCMNQTWKIGLKPIKKPYSEEDNEELASTCTQVRKASPSAFNHFKGKTHKYITEYP